MTSESNPQEHCDEPKELREYARMIFGEIKEGYNELVNMIIRPPRASYEMKHLGPARFLIDTEGTGKSSGTKATGGEIECVRMDFDLRNDANYKLFGSLWMVDPENSGKDSEELRRPCIIVLHGNSSCRASFSDIVYYALARGFAVCAFDFSGSGMSQGKYVSLGYHESKDVAAVIKYLKKTNYIAPERIVLWGRSMGAVAALMYAQEHPDDVSAMVLDSPFARFTQLVWDLIDRGQLTVPRLVVSMMLPMVRRSIRSRAKFDISNLQPIQKQASCKVPALFAYGDSDELIPGSHSESLYAAHSGPKELKVLKGGHNDLRDPDFYVTSLDFIAHYAHKGGSRSCATTHDFMDTNHAKDTQTKLSPEISPTRSTSSATAATS